MFDRRLIQNFDWILFLLLIFIVSASLLNLYSATFQIRNMGGTLIFRKQVYWFMIGFAAFFIMTTFDYHLLERLAYPIYYSVLLLLVAVLIIGSVKSGSKRWIPIGPIYFQPSEMAKFAILIITAKFFSDQQNLGQKEYTLLDLWKPAFLSALPAILILKEPDLGTAVVILAISFSMMLFARIKIKSLIILATLVVVASPVFWLNLKGYQQKRIMTFLNPEKDIQGSGYHIYQSKIAIGSGQLTGKGFLKGTQARLHFLPEQHTDFAFSVFAEEWGFVGCIVLLFLYCALVLWALKIAAISKDPFASFLAVGIGSLVFWEVVVNIGMVTGLLPVVGIPLLLFSYGGSSILSTMAAMGLLMNISMRRFMFQ